MQDLSQALLLPQIPVEAQDTIFFGMINTRMLTLLMGNEECRMVRRKRHVLLLAMWLDVVGACDQGPAGCGLTGPRTNGVAHGVR